MVDWADHEEVVAQLNARIAYFRQQAEEWRTEAMRLRQNEQDATELLSTQQWRCDECGFRISLTGGENNPGPCPNDAQTMAQLTWKELSEENYHAALTYAKRATLVENRIDQLIDLGFQPRLCNHFGRRVVALYQGTTIPWGDGGEGDTWEEALNGSLEILKNNGYGEGGQHD